MANPGERRGRDVTLRGNALYGRAKTAAQEGAFHNKSWAEVARGVKDVFQRPFASNVAKLGFGMGIGMICPPLALLASTVVDSLSVVGDTIADLGWDQIESRLWQMVERDPMADVHAKAGTDPKSSELMDELKVQLSQVVATVNAIEKLERAPIVYCDDLHYYALIFETMTTNIEQARANATSLRTFLDKVLTVLPDDMKVKQMETKVKQTIEAKIDTLGHHYDGSWISGRQSMCSNVHCQGPV